MSRRVRLVLAFDLHPAQNLRRRPCPLL